MKDEAERARLRAAAREQSDREYGGVDYGARAETEAAASHGAREPSTSQDGRPDLYGLEEKCQREFAASPALRDEFAGNLEAYVAYRKAEARGRVRIFGGKHREA